MVVVTGSRNRRNTTMQRPLAAVLAVLAMTSLMGSTPGFARGGFAHGGFAHGAGLAHDPTAQFGATDPQAPALANRIPAPLSGPSQAPVINGPMSQPAFRGLSGIGQ
jgi:hypothetical protein